MSTPLELVIFDCDGVLVESEAIFARVDAEMLSALGFEITESEIRSRFAGISTRDMLRTLEEEQNRRPPDGFLEERQARLDEVFERELVAMPGIHDALERIAIPVCVASSATAHRIAKSLKIVGLFEPFQPHLFSSEMVENGKPAPDLFLHAAASLQVRPGATAVVEDSVHGIKGARAAGMRAIGFAGASHCEPDHAGRLEEAGAEQVLHDLRDLPAELGRKG